MTTKPTATPASRAAASSILRSFLNIPLMEVPGNQSDPDSTSPIPIGGKRHLIITGCRGSGKSTLLKIIGCMDTPTAGKYFLDNTEVTVASRSQVHKLRKEKIGYVFQHFALMDYYTAYENIELPLLAANVKRMEKKRIILKQMEHLGILSERNKLPGKMSGGQQQRVAIARALVTNADIILADEPTGALDQKTGHEVLELLKEINKSGKTVIIVTHDEGIAKMTNRIITISDGKIVGDN